MGELEKGEVKEARPEIQAAAAAAGGGGAHRFVGSGSARRPGSGVREISRSSFWRRATA